MNDRIVLLCMLLGLGKDDEQLEKIGYSKEEIKEAKKINNKAEQKLWRKENG